MSMNISVTERKRLAAACGIAEQYLYQVLTGRRECGPEIAVRIEKATYGAVMRWDLRPNDWHLIWPELATSPKAPKRAQKEAA